MDFLETELIIDLIDFLEIESFLISEIVLTDFFDSDFFISDFFDFDSDFLISDFLDSDFFTDFCSILTVTFNFLDPHYEHITFELYSVFVLDPALEFSVLDTDIGVISDIPSLFLISKLGILKLLTL